MFQKYLNISKMFEHLNILEQLNKHILQIWKLDQVGHISQITQPYKSKN